MRHFARRPQVPLVVALLLLAQAVRAEACPFCEVPTLTLAELVEENETVVLTKWVDAEPTTDAVLGKTVYEVIDVLKSESARVKKGDTITLRSYRPGEESDLFLLYAGQGTDVQWNSPMEMTEAGYQYLRKAPSLEVNSVDRLRYFMKYLEYPDQTVSNDAYGEFGLAPYEALLPLKDEMPRDRLRQWIKDPETDPTRLGLYGLMIGLCGDESDKEMLGKKVLEPANEDDFRIGIDGLMAGYLMLAGAEGLDKLDAHKVEPKYVVQDGEFVLDKEGNKQKLPFAEPYAVQKALRFMWTYEEGRIPKERLKQSMRKLLLRSNMSDLVLGDLARWHDWEIMDKAMELYDDEEYALPSFQRTVARYLVRATRDVDENADSTPAHVQNANRYLAELEKSDPDIVATARRYYENYGE